MFIIDDIINTWLGGEYQEDMQRKSVAQQNQWRKEDWQHTLDLTQIDFDNQLKLNGQLMSGGLQNSKELSQFNNNETLRLAQQMPDAQIKGLRNAGINTATMGGGLSSPVTSSSSSAPTTQAQLSSTAANTISQLAQARATSQLASAQSKNLNADTSLKFAQLGNVVADTIKKGIDSKFTIKGLDEMQSRIALNVAKKELTGLMKDEKKVDIDFLKDSLKDRLRNTKALADISEKTLDEVVERIIYLQHKSVTEVTQQGLNASQAKVNESTVETNRANVQINQEKLSQEWKRLGILGYEADTARMLANSGVKLNDAHIENLRTIDKHYDAMTRREKKQASLIQEQITSAHSEAEIKEALSSVQSSKIYQWLKAINEELSTVSGTVRNFAWAVEALKGKTK